MRVPTASEPRAVVVTGASTGIGADAAAALAAAGFTVYAGVRNDEAAAAIAGPAIRAIRLDVTKPAEIAAAVERVAADGLPLAGVVNNAGIAIGGPLEYCSLDAFRLVIETNLIGAIAVTQAFLPALRGARGRIVFVGSISGRIATPYVAPYAASKFALRAVADALRLELFDDGIDVTLIEPGAIRTPIWRKGIERRAASLEALGPAGRARYGRAIEALFDNLAREERNALPVARVTAVIVDALTSATPPADKLVGMQAKIASIIAVLPARLRSALLRRAQRA